MADQDIQTLTSKLNQSIAAEKFKLADKRRRELEEDAKELEEETAAKIRKLKHEASLETTKITSQGWPEKSPYDLPDDRVDQKALKKDKEAFMTLMKERLNEALTKLSAGDYIWMSVEVEDATTEVFKKFQVASVERYPDPGNGSLIYFVKPGFPEATGFALFNSEQNSICFFPSTIAGFDKDTVLPLYQCFHMLWSGKAATFIAE